MKLPSSKLALSETKGWLIVGGIVLAAGAALYLLVKKGVSTVGKDLANAPGAVISTVGDALAGTVAGAANAVGKYGLAVNDALGGLPGSVGNGIVAAGTSIGTMFNGEMYTGSVYSTKENRWTQVIGLNSGDSFNVNANGDVLSSSGSVIGHFSG